MKRLLRHLDVPLAMTRIGWRLFSLSLKCFPGGFLLPTHLQSLTLQAVLEWANIRLQTEDQAALHADAMLVPRGRKIRRYSRAGAVPKDSICTTRIDSRKFNLYYGRSQPLRYQNRLSVLNNGNSHDAQHASNIRRRMMHAPCCPA